LTVKEAQMNAEAILSETRSQVRDMLDQADEHAKDVMEQSDKYSKESLTTLNDNVKSVTEDLRDVENRRDVVLRELTLLANDTLARVNKISTEKIQVTTPKNEVVKTVVPTIEKPTITPPEAKTTTNEISFEINTTFEDAEIPNPNKHKEEQGGSFFDNLG